jgi:ATP synthase protein I
MTSPQDKASGTPEPRWPELPDPAPPPPIPEHLLQPVKRPSIDPDRPRPVDPSGLGDLMRGIGLALDALFMVAAGAVLGWLVDYWLRSSPWGLILGLALGFVLSTVRLIQRLNTPEPPGPGAHPTPPRRDHRPGPP